MNAPLRWKDAGSEADAALRQVMRHAREQGPSDAQLEALTEAVRARLPAEPAAPATTVLPMKTLAASAAALLAGIGCWLALSSPPSDARPRPAPAASAKATPAIVPSAAPTPEEPAPKPEVTLPAAAGTAEAPARARQARRAVRPQASPGAAPAAPPDELTLLHRARQLARSDAAGALAATREHEHFYPEGVFREEREALLIELLVRTGQHAEGRARLAAFLQRYPNSAYGARVKHSLGADLTPADARAPTRAR